MFKIYVFLGKTGVGKSAIYQAVKGLIAPDDNISEIIMHTTRPKRKGEVDGVDYHFDTKDEILKLYADHKLAELRSYKVDSADDDFWYYGTPDMKDKSRVYILGNSTALSCMSLIEKYGRDIVKPIFITCDEYLRLERLLKREHDSGNSNYKEMIRRIYNDNLDYDDEILSEFGIDMKFDNSEIYIDKCASDVYNYIKKNMNE